MLRQNCPCCKNQISFLERLVLIYRFYGTCKYCGKDYLPNKNAMIISSAVLGTISGITGAAFLKLDTFTLFIFCTFIVVLFQRLINIFYTLEAVDD